MRTKLLLLITLLFATPATWCGGTDYAMASSDYPKSNISYNGKGINIDAVFSSFNHNSDNPNITDEEAIAAFLCELYSVFSEINGNILTDKDHFEGLQKILKLFEKGVSDLDSIGSTRGFYIYQDTSDMIPVKWMLTSIYEKNLEWVKADSIFSILPNEIRRDFGADSEEYVFWTNQCAAGITRKHNQYPKAIDVMRPALDAALKSSKVSNETACDFLISFSQKNDSAGHHEEAFKYALEAEKRCENIRPLIYRASNLLAELYASRGNNEEAIKHYEVAAANYSSLSEFLANSMGYASFCRKNGDAQTALDILFELEKYIDSDELDFRDKFNYYEQVGVCATFIDPNVSKTYFEKAAQYSDYLTMPEVIRHLLNTSVYPNNDNTFKVIDALTRAEQSYSMVGCEEPRLLCEIVWLHGHYLLMINDLEQAYKYLETALGLALDYSDADPFMRNIYQDMAIYFEKVGRPEMQKAMLEAYLDCAKPHGDDSEIYLDAIAGLLRFNIREGSKDRAKELLDFYLSHRPKAYDALCYRIGYEAKFGDINKAVFEVKTLLNEFPDYSVGTVNLCEDILSIAKSVEIIPFASANLENYKKETARQLLFMNSDERINLVRETSDRKSIAMSRIDISPELNAIALDYSLFTKGLLLNTHRLVQNSLTLNDSAKIELQKIRQLKAELNNASISGDSAMCGKLRFAIGQRERYVINDFVDEDAIQKELTKVSFSAIRDNLPSSAIAIDFIMYHKDGEDKYGAFVFSKSDVTPNYVEINPKHSNVYEGVWSKLTPYFTNENEVYFCPDGVLNDTGIEYALCPDGLPINQKFNLHRVFHLSEIPDKTDIGNQIVAVGVSDYNSPAGKGQTLNRGSWANLDNVKSEMELIKTNLHQKGLKILFNDEATESNVKNLASTGLTTLHISAHGVYRNQKALLKSAYKPDDDDCNIARRLMQVGKKSLSGLILRGGNLAWKSSELSGEEDDILTAEEIELLNFTSLNLTVLSACDTGLGDVDSEGVWGLQRAFRIAGSRNLICSLSKVDDYWTSQFMGAFYKYAGNGDSIYDSFQKAHRELFEATPDNPEVWSSFILIE